VTAKPQGPDSKTFKFSFVLIGGAVVLWIISFSIGIAALAWLGMALFWIGIILNMITMVTRLRNRR